MGRGQASGSRTKKVESLAQATAPTSSTASASRRVNFIARHLQVRQYQGAKDEPEAISDNNLFLLEKVTWTRMGHHGKPSEP